MQGRIHESARQTSLPRCQSLGRAVGNGVAHSHAAPKVRPPGNTLALQYSLHGVSACESLAALNELHNETMVVCRRETVCAGLANSVSKHTHTFRLLP